MFKISLFKMIGSAVLALTVGLGLVAPAALAAGPAPVAACTAKWNGFNAKTSEQGLMITDVTKDSPAAKAGLMTNEILLSANGKNISQQADLDQLVAGAKAGDKLTLEIARQGGPVYKLVVILGKNADKPYLGLQAEQVSVEMGPFTYVVNGVANCSSRPFELSSSVARGLFVTSVDPNSADAKAGLAAGDVILDVNGKPVGAPDNLTKTISSLKSGDVVTLNLYRPLASQKYLTIKITLGDKPALSAQVAVMVAGATINAVSSQGSRIGAEIEGLLTHHVTKFFSFPGQISHSSRSALRWFLSRFHFSKSIS